MSESNNPTQEPPSRRADEEITHHYDWSETSPTLAVVEAISVAGNREQTDHRPLYDAVDTDALNDLFRGGNRPPRELEVSFTYEGFDVTVAAAGWVTVRAADEFPA